MPGEKTEQPTPKRINEARKKGEVFKSRDLNQALLFATAAAVLTMGGSAYVAQLQDLLKQSFQPDVMKGDMPMNAMLTRMGAAWSKFLLLSTPLLGTLVIAGAASNFAQVKALFAPEIV